MRHNVCFGSTDRRNGLGLVAPPHNDVIIRIGQEIKGVAAAAIRKRAIDEVQDLREGVPAGGENLP